MGANRHDAWGVVSVDRHVLRLVTHAMLFLLALLTGMLIPPVWVAGR